MDMRRSFSKLDAAVDPSDKGTPVNLFCTALFSSRALPIAETFVELCELFSKPEQADLVREVIILIASLKVTEYALGAPRAKCLIVACASIGARACDNEEKARPSLIRPSLFDDPLTIKVKIGRVWIELDDFRSLPQREEERVEVAILQLNNLLCFH